MTRAVVIPTEGYLTISSHLLFSGITSKTIFYNAEIFLHVIYTYDILSKKVDYIY